MASWGDWAHASGCTVLMVAHPSKSSAEYSGSTDWQAAARAVWTLGREKDSKDDAEEAPVLECTKSSYAKRPASLTLTGETRWRVRLASDADSGGRGNAGASRFAGNFERVPCV